MATHNFRRIPGLIAIGLGIVVPTMMQVGPTDAEANLCHWFAWLGATENCLRGLPPQLIWFVSTILVIAGFLWIWPSFPRDMLWLSRQWRIRSPLVRRQGGKTAIVAISSAAARSEASETAPPQPNASVKWALEYLDSLFPLNQVEPSSFQEMRQAARLGQITVWGRPDNSTYKPREPISQDHWRHYGFDDLVCRHDPDESNCCTEPDNSQRHYKGECYRDLMVNRAQIERQWPSVSDGNEAKSKKRTLVTKGRQLLVQDASRRRGTEWDFGDLLEKQDFYYDLRPYLSEEFIKRMNARGRVVIVPPERSRLSGLAIEFSKEIDRLEQEWGLRE